MEEVIAIIGLGCLFAIPPAVVALGVVALTTYIDNKKQKKYERDQADS